MVDVVTCAVGGIFLFVSDHTVIAVNPWSRVRACVVNEFQLCHNKVLIVIRTFLNS